MSWLRFFVVVVLLAGAGSAAVFWFYARGKIGAADASVPLPQVIGVRPEPADMPQARPFVGEEGLDRDGYPRRAADRPALLQLLMLGMYDELDRYLVEYQDDFEADPKKEYWPLDAFDTFREADPAVGIGIDEWIEKKPNSWAARMARGCYRESVGWFSRGGDTSFKTGLARFRAMDKAFDEARQDLLAALAARPKLVAAQRILLRMTNTSSQLGTSRAILTSALETCPSCFQIRVTYLMGLTPRWGGSYEAMSAFAREAQAQVESNPRLASLPGYVEWDRCDTAMIEEDNEGALKHCETLEPYRNADFDAETADVLIRLKRNEEALRLLDRGIAQRPQQPDILEQRVFALHNLDRWEAMGEAALALRRQNVTRPGYARAADLAVAKLLWGASQEVQAKRFERGQSLLNLALLIEPTNADAKKLLAKLPSYQASMTPARAKPVDAQQKDQIDRLQKAIAEAPDDFSRRKALDDALFALNRFDEIVGSWDDYLRRNPNDARAFLERAGTHSHRRDAKAALADFDAACKLNEREGCRAALTMRHQLGLSAQ